jgi:glutathione peroxidase
VARTIHAGPASLYEIEAALWDGQVIRLDQFKGQVLLVVNVASRCGFTPQYAGLESLYRKYRDQGLVVLGFPCNQFAGQEPASEREIHRFCVEHYQVTFPLFSKIDVNGATAHPVYVFLKSQHGGGGLLGVDAIKWNFTKFLVDRAGRVTARFGPTTTPEALETRVRELLGANDEQLTTDN